MKTLVALTALGAAALALPQDGPARPAPGQAAHQAPARQEVGETPAPAPEAPANDARLAELELRLQAVEAELRATRELLGQAVTHLNATAEASEAMLATLAAAEEAGFTAGINWRSRELLLAGWREWLAAQQAELPAPPAPAAPAPEPLRADARAGR